MKIASSPSGAKIYDGEELIGTTPAFVELGRAKEKSLILKAQGKPDREFKLQGEYRWGDSFVANFVWLNYVYVGLANGIDWYTGAMWDYHPQALIKWHQDDPVIMTPLRKIALAPPQINNEVVSDELAIKVERTLKKKYPFAEVLKYEDTVGSFARYSYLNDTKTPNEFRDDLYYSLGVTHIAETETEVHGDEVVLKSSVNDVFTDRTVETLETKLAKKNLPSMNRGWLGTQLTELVSLVPNTVAFNFATYEVNIHERSDDITQQYRSRIDRDASVLNYLTGFTLKNVKSSEIIKRWKVTLRFVPSISLGYNRMKFDRTIANDLIDKSFTWYAGSFGFGPEVGLEMPVGLLYLDVIPAIGISHVTWSKEGDYTDTRGIFLAEAEFGYLVFVSQNINLRLYVNVVSGHRDQWSSVLTTATGRGVDVMNASYSSGGLSIGYFFPEIRSTARKIVR